MLQDIKYALRLLVKTPGFSLLTLLAMAAGIGLSVYMLTLNYTLAFASTPFPDHNRLVMIDAVVDGFEQNGGAVGYFDYLEYAKVQTSFDHFYPVRSASTTLSGERYPERFNGSQVPSGTWAYHGVKPLLGRTLQASDEQAGAAPAIVIGYEVWQSYFGGDAAVVGKSVKVNGKATTVVGVMPAGFAFPVNEQLWLPHRPPSPIKPGDDGQQVVAHLKPGATMAQAQAELSAVADRLAKQYPESNRTVGVKVHPYTQSTMTNSMPIIYLMLGATAAIMLLVWVNVGNLLLARANERHKELAIRAALGAPRQRLLRQMMAEAGLLSLAAGVLGLFFAAWGLEATHPILQGMSNGPMPFWFDLQPSMGTVWLAAVITALTCIATGLLPAWRASNTELASVLRDGTRGAQGRAAGRFTRALVIGEIVLSCGLLIASMVLVYSVKQSVNADYGIKPDHVLTGRVNIKQPAYEDPNNQRALWDKLIQSLRQQPGVQAAALTDTLPGSFGTTKDVLIDGKTVANKQYPRVGVITIGDGYFKALQVPLLAGREFDQRDTADGLRSAIVSEGFAKDQWPGQSALGKRFQIDPGTPGSPWFTVIGVNRHIVQGQVVPGLIDAPSVYLSLMQQPTQFLSVVLVGQDNPLALTDTLRRAVSQVDGNLPVYFVDSLTEKLRKNGAGMSFVGGLFLLLGALGLLLAVSGIYGVTARAVTLRTQEIGVRRALGASDGQVMSMLLKGGSRQLMIGLPLGLLLGFGLTAAIAHMLYQAELIRWLALPTIAVLIGSVVLLATWLPARRAIALPPNVALRYE